MARFFGFQFPSVTGLFGSPSVNEVQSRQGGIPFNPTRDGITRGWTYDPMDQFSPPAFGVSADTGPSSGPLDRIFALFDGGNPPGYNWSTRDPRGYSPRIPDETGGVSYGVAPGGAVIPDETGGVSFATAPGGATLPDESGGVSRGFVPDNPYLPDESGGVQYVTQDMLSPGAPSPNEYERSQSQRFGQGFLDSAGAFVNGATEYFTRQPR